MREKCWRGALDAVKPLRAHRAPPLGAQAQAKAAAEAEARQRAEEDARRAAAQAAQQGAHMAPEAYGTSSHWDMQVRRCLILTLSAHEPEARAEHGRRHNAPCAAACADVYDIKRPGRRGLCTRMQGGGYGYHGSAGYEGSAGWAGAMPAGGAGAAGYAGAAAATHGGQPCWSMHAGCWAGRHKPPASQVNILPVMYAHDG